MTLRICVVVPVFNHGDGAVALAGAVSALRLPMIFVNDGSGDQTAGQLKALSDRYENVEVICHPENRGKGAAVLTGLRAAHAKGFSHVLQIDADGQHDVGDVPAFLEKAAQFPHAVIAGQPKFDDSVPTGRLAARYLTHVWIWIETLSFRIKDSMCGFRIYPLGPVIRVADRISLGQRMDFDPEVLVRLYWEGVDIVPLPTRVIYPRGGTSHFRMWLDNWLITRMHTRLVFGMIWRVFTLRAGRFGGPSGRKQTAE